MQKEGIREGVATSKQNVNLSSIWFELLQGNRVVNSKLTTSPLTLTMSSSVMNHSDFKTSDNRDEIFNTQDRDFLSVLEELAGIDDP